MVEEEANTVSQSYVLLTGDEGTARDVASADPWSVGADGGAWKIETRYYEAVTTVRVASLDEAKALVEAEGHPPQALVACFKGEESEAAVRTAIEKWAWLDEVEVKLLVADGMTPDLSLGKLEIGQESWLSRCYDWCMSRGFEYVEASTDDEEVDGSLVLFEDKQGVSRVVEALHCHMWPGCALKDQAKGEEGGRAEDRGGERAETGDGDGDDEDDGDLGLADFDEMLAKVKSTREGSAHLSDEERRKNAERMLLSIMSDLGIEDL